LVIGHSTLNGELNIFIYYKMSRKNKTFENNKKRAQGETAGSYHQFMVLLKGGKLSSV
jgi:hypothetical protein